MRNEHTKKIVILALLTAIVVVLQFIGAAIHFGTFSISLVLIPIVIGAALCGPFAGAWLGFVFSVIVLFTDSQLFLAINTVGTIITVLVKGTLAGYLSGLVFQGLQKKNRTLAIILASITCPLVNTGTFLVGCLIFFYEAMSQWAQAFGMGDNVLGYMIVGLVGVNFIFEVIFNGVLSPTIIRLLDYAGKKGKQ